MSLLCIIDIDPIIDHYHYNRPTRDKPIDHRGVEIVEVPMLVDQQPDAIGSAVKIVQAKLDNKIAYRDYALLVFVNSTKAPSIITVLQNHVSRSMVGPNGINEVWTMNVKNAGGFIFELREIYPGRSYVVIDPVEEVRRGEVYPHKRLDSLKARGRGK